MRILLTNDDGLYAEGLQSLIRSLKQIADLTVIAPDRERSAVGHSLTFFNPLRIQKIKRVKNCVIYSSDGTPSDCVLLGIYDLMSRKPDLIISGINHGSNMGQDITYSGTVSAAMEGAIHGIPSAAISLAAFEGLNFKYAAKFAKKIAKAVIKKGLPSYYLLNVNIPNVPESQIKGIEITKQGRSIYEQRLIKRTDPRGVEYYWITGEVPSGDISPGTDFKAIHENKVSITPINLLKMTDLDFMRKLKKWNLKK